MSVLRSIAAVVFGFIVAIAVIIGTEAVNMIVHMPEGKTTDDIKELMKDKPAAKAYFESMPTSALATVLAGWLAGAFLGGGIAALIAGRARVVHAGIIGALILAACVFNFYSLKNEYEFSHPDWMIVAGLVLPLPASLIAGKIVSWMFSPSSVSYQ